MNRRDFLKGSILICVTSSTLPWISACSNLPKLLFASAFSTKEHRHFVGWFDEKGLLVGQVELPQRAHDLAYIKTQNKILAFARRPGNQLYVINLVNLKLEKTINSEKNYHFYGHGVLNDDETLLFTTENFFDNDLTERKGIVTVRHTSDFSLVRQFSSYGVGPHQLAMLNNGQTLVVANGGIHTHPKKRREKLNLDTMESNLSYINAGDGKLLEQHSLKDNKLSIRHLCVANDDTVYFGCQYQGEIHKINPLIYKHNIGDTVSAFQATQSQWIRFKHYIASLSVNTESELAVTSPRGGIVSIWDRKSMTLKSISQLDDTAGIASCDTQFVATNGRGNLVGVNKQLITLADHDVKWDNHLISFKV